jgi:hypothetical protein
VDVSVAPHHPIPTVPALFQVIRHLSDAMEGNRKGNVEHEVASLALAWRTADWYARIMDYRIDSAIDEKMAYNRERADHKIENRLKPGGKAY